MAVVGAFVFHKHILQLSHITIVHTMISHEGGMNPVAMIIISPRKEPAKPWIKQTSFS